ncbi:MAG TPA: biotin--[acetyl-CoA-carboxylase] ligase [Flavobacteriales bacterium]|nr:biotin--[acetyl-CoA-carboxylase] ligase [Flavobacteriales bacterium]
MPIALPTSFIGGQLLEFDSVASTNKTAAELLSQSKVRHGAVILAHEQTDGRGQRGRSWISRSGLDLTFSIVLQPHGLRADAQFALGKIAALAVHDAVQHCVSGDVRIKWPNDILVERRKVAGILIKNEVVGELVMSSIVGIGLNVNSTGLDPDLVGTSLAMEGGRALDRITLLGTICERFEHWLARWEQLGEEGLGEYSGRLWARGRWTEVHLDEKSVMVRPVDVDPHGRLIVEHEDGSVLAYGLDRLRFAPR